MLKSVALTFALAASAAALQLHSSNISNSSNSKVVVDVDVDIDVAKKENGKAFEEKKFTHFCGHKFGVKGAPDLIAPASFDVAARKLKSGEITKVESSPIDGGGSSKAFELLQSEYSSSLKPRVGVMVCGNSGRPGGGCGDVLTDDNGF